MEVELQGERKKNDGVHKALFVFQIYFINTRTKQEAEKMKEKERNGKKLSPTKLVLFVMCLLSESKQKKWRETISFRIKIDGFLFEKRNLIISMQY